MRKRFLPFAGFHNVRNAGWLGHASFGNRFLLALLILCTIVSFMVRPLTALPQEIQLAAGQTHNLPLPYGITGRLQPRNLSGNVVQVIRTPGHHLALNPLAAGEADLEFRLLGIVPVHSVVVKVSPEVQVMLGGHSIGVVVSTRGVMVTGVVPVRTPQGARSPAQQAGIAVGDIVLSVDGQEVKDEVHLSELVQAAGHEQRRLVVELEREGKRLQTSVSPVDTGDGVFRIGLAVRDATAGVGTLTFWDPANRRFAALGHMVTDSDTGQPIRLESGHIVPAGVMAIHQGRRGEPGEKVGVFMPDRDVLGDIEANTPYGITGTLRKTPANPTFPQPVPLAGAATVHAGPAQILTVVEGESIGVFQAYIQKVMPDRLREGKGLVLRITDGTLRRQTGGIVQGMSGSPILQDGRLVGAVTHVFVNDPTRGYGVLAQWMWEEMTQQRSVRVP